jgi:predicted esterase
MKIGMFTLGCVVVLLSAAGARGQDAEAFHRAYSEADWARAAEAGERWALRDPEDSTAAYNAACAQALNGRPEEALVWLRRAGEAGFAGTRSIDQDPDLESVRKLAAFEVAVKGIRANRASLFDEFKTEAERSEILTILPPGVGAGPRPLIVVLHGYGGTPEINAELYREVAGELGAIIAAPGAIRPGPRGWGFSWTFRDEAEWWVLRAIERVSSAHEVDTDRLILAGFSQGANVALAVGLAYPERFTGLLPVAGHYERHLMPSRYQVGPRVYLLTGQQDSALSTFRAAAVDLAEAGLDVRLRVIPGLGHAFPRRSTRELRKALAFLLAE